jgi:hypothetical protein
MAITLWRRAAQRQTWRSGGEDSRGRRPPASPPIQRRTPTPTATGCPGPARFLCARTSRGTPCGGSSPLLGSKATAPRGRGRERCKAAGTAAPELGAGERAPFSVPALLRHAIRRYSACPTGTSTCMRWSRPAINADRCPPPGTHVPVNAPTLPTAPHLRPPSHVHIPHYVHHSFSPPAPRN